MSFLLAAEKTPEKLNHNAQVNNVTLVHARVGKGQTLFLMNE